MSEPTTDQTVPAGAERTTGTSSEKLPLNRPSAEVPARSALPKALALGLLAALFFSVTFLANRRIGSSGGSWMWTAALRYILSLPMLWGLLLIKRETGPVYAEIKAAPKTWFLWSIVGFFFFYAPLSIASLYGESWFTAAVWQIVIVTGVLLTPLFGAPIPKKNLLFCLVILLGIGLLQTEHFGSASAAGLIIPLLLNALAAVAYTLGNRNMMGVCAGKLNTAQRVFGMTLCSMPAWLILAAAAFLTSGLPSAGQVGQSVLVAFFSCTVGTLLYFEATNLVRSNMKHLAIAESTLAAEIPITLVAGILLLGDPVPSPVGFLGLGIIIIGMILNSVLGAK